ncbi:hypothetical protein NX722_04720 [Endozoicomonas gorgoniicola]|uniref:Fork-head domain-containing protein n=1 Tax=Endozoicomonas gorgoniicola TaxID=1234144 RepID=A0ABT3MS66_9GAMM|nr:hypothetical protein [Endozoicomonas gorgoniicola]MCW7551953.1 hypothetical protein [Endozoicomonas gorgoniicola]
MAQKDSSSKPSPRADWKNSIRHNLSLHKTLFRKRDATPPGISSSLWSAIEDKVADYMFIDEDRLITVYKRRKQPNSTTSSLSKSQNCSENKNTGRPVKRKISSSSTITSPQTSTVTKALPEGDNLSPATTSVAEPGYDTGERKLKVLKLEEVNEVLRKDGLPVPEPTFTTLDDGDLTLDDDELLKLL